MGADPGPPSARALRRAGRRPVARSSALDSSEVRRLLPAREGPQSRLSREVCRGAATRVRPATSSTSPAAASTCATRRSGTPSSTRSSRPTGSSTPSRPSVGASAVLRYLGRYTHRVAISNHRLLAFDGDRVTFQWKDYAHGDQRRTMTLVRDGVSAPLRPAHPAARLRPHPAVGLSREHLSDGPRGPRAHLARRTVDRRRRPLTRPRRRPPTARPRDVGLSALRRRDDRRPDPLGAPPGDGHARLRHLMTADALVTTGVLVDVVAHVSGDGVPRSARPQHRRTARRVGARATHRAACRRRSRAAGPSIRPPATREDPTSSSIAGRRASGFLQVSLSKVPRHPHRAARPASRAETPPMNANDLWGVTVADTRDRPVELRRRYANRRNPLPVLSAGSTSARIGRLASSDLTEEPGLRGLPVPHDGLRRDVQDIRCFVDGQAAKESQLDNLAHTRIERRQCR